MGRAPAFWNEENFRLVRDNFVAVSVSNYEQGRQDAVGEFFRNAEMKLPGAGGSQWAVTAGGQVLLVSRSSGFNIKLALEKWNALPEAERAPGAIEIADLDEIDTERALPAPPEGGLILKIYYRAFMRDGGKLRYVTGRDLWHDETGEKTEAHRDQLYPGRITTPQAQPDHMWLTEAEWKSLLPADPQPGDTFPLPKNISDRIVRRHLNPLTVYGETNPLPSQAVRDSELSLTAETVSASSVRLRLDGFARLGDDPPAAVAEGQRAAIGSWGHEPRLLGFLEYDPNRQVITRFDIVAFGDHFGRLGIADSATRVGLQPLGISFELVTGETPADRIPPGRSLAAKNYFQ